VRGAEGDLRFADVASVGEDALVVHDAHRDDPSLAFALSRLSASPDGPTPIGIFRDVARPVSGRALARELQAARPGDAELDAVLGAGDSWVVA
jgi:2-oxoglutarate ferredoxin oxidoreductase subunit beta